jgi:hypothetical protein
MSRIGILDSLEREQKDLLVTWIETLPIKLVLEKVASPPPEGFNIRTHITSLRRFYQRERNAHTRENIDFARGACMSANDAEVIREAAVAALTHHAFEVATTPGFGEYEMSRAMRWLTALQQQEIKLEQLRLRREKLLLEKHKLQIHAAVAEAATYSADGVKTIREAAAQLGKLHKDQT